MPELSSCPESSGPTREVRMRKNIESLRNVVPHNGITALRNYSTGTLSNEEQPVWMVSPTACWLNRF